MKVQQLKNGNWIVIHSNGKRYYSHTESVSKSYCIEQMLIIQINDAQSKMDKLWAKITDQAKKEKRANKYDEVKLLLNDGSHQEHTCNLGDLLC